MSAFILYANHEKSLLRALGVGENRLQYCKPIRPFAEAMHAAIDENRKDQNKKSYKKIIKENWYVDESGNPLKKSDYKSSRYRQVNLHRYLTTTGRPDNTLEFRTFNSNTDPDVLDAYVFFILTGASFAKHLPDIPLFADDPEDLELFLAKCEDMMTNYVGLDAVTFEVARRYFEPNWKKG